MLSAGLNLGGIFIVLPRVSSEGWRGGGVIPPGVCVGGRGDGKGREEARMRKSMCLSSWSKVMNGEEGRRERRNGWKKRGEK